MMGELGIIRRGPVFVLEPAVFAGQVDPEDPRLAGIPLILIKPLVLQGHKVANGDERFAESIHCPTMLGKLETMLGKLETMLGGCVRQLPDGVHKLDYRVFEGCQSLFGGHWMAPGLGRDEMQHSGCKGEWRQRDWDEYDRD